MFSKIKNYIPIILIILLMIVLSIYIDKQNIINSKDLIIEYSKENLLLSATLFTIVYLICVALSLPIATILTLLAGIVFGPLLGTSIVVIGATVGAIIIFLAIKKASNNKSLLEKYKNSKSLLTLQKNIKDNAANYLLFARLVPIFPFVLVNIAPATVGVKLSTFAWTTFIGIIPGSFVYTYLGYQSGQIENIKDLVSGEMISALVLLGVFSLLPIFIKKLKNRGNNNGKSL